MFNRETNAHPSISPTRNTVAGEVLSFAGRIAEDAETTLDLFYSRLGRIVIDIGLVSCPLEEEIFTKQYPEYFQLLYEELLKIDARLQKIQAMIGKSAFA
jgi:hypothetical protein